MFLLGPLYHLVDQGERVQALNEARRVVRRGGFVHAAAISRWAARLDGMLLQRLQIAYPVVTEVIDEVERTGVLMPLHDTAFCGYTHTPDQLREEVRTSGLELESLVTVEGIAFALCDIDARMDDADERALVLGAIRAIESVPDLLGVGPHLLATARKASQRR